LREYGFPRLAKDVLGQRASGDGVSAGQASITYLPDLNPKMIAKRKPDYFSKQ